MHRVVLQHVAHVVHTNEWVVYTHDLHGRVGQRSTHDKAVAADGLGLTPNQQEEYLGQLLDYCPVTLQVLSKEVKPLLVALQDLLEVLEELRVVVPL